MTTYYSPNGDAIVTTDAVGLYQWPLWNAASGVDARVWTGMYEDWTIGGNCQDWSSGAPDVGGIMGQAMGTDVDSLFAMLASCDQEGRIYCVETLP